MNSRNEGGEKMQIMAPAKTYEPAIITVYGKAGIGKSSIAKLCNSVYIDIEGSISQLEVAKTSKVKNYKEVFQAFRLIAESEYSTVVVDTLDALEVLGVKQICEENGWQSLADGDFGQGYEKLKTLIGEFIGACKKLKEDYKKNVILVAHEKVSRIGDPTASDSYESINTNLDKRVNDLVHSLCDAVLYMTLNKVEKKNKVGKLEMLTDGSRCVMATPNTKYLAKNRFGWPAVMPMDEGGENFKKLLMSVFPEGFKND